MRSRKSMMIFALAALLAASCAYAFDYRRYAVRIEPVAVNGFDGPLELIEGPADGSQDLVLADCVARSDDGTPCVMLPRTELRRLQEDMARLKADNARLRARCR